MGLEAGNRHEDCHENPSQAASGWGWSVTLCPSRSWQPTFVPRVTAPVNTTDNKADFHVFGSREPACRLSFCFLFKSPCPYRAPQDGSPEVATGHHVMDRAGIFDPQRSDHAQ